MKILTLADFSKALNLNNNDISEIKQIANNRIKIKWIDGLRQTFTTNKPIKLITNRLSNMKVCFKLNK